MNPSVREKERIEQVTSLAVRGLMIRSDPEEICLLHNHSCISSLFKESKSQTISKCEFFCRKKKKRENTLDVNLKKIICKKNRYFLFNKTYYNSFITNFSPSYFSLSQQSLATS